MGERVKGLVYDGVVGIKGYMRLVSTSCILLNIG